MPIIENTRSLKTPHLREVELLRPLVKGPQNKREEDTSNHEREDREFRQTGEPKPTPGDLLLFAGEFRGTSLAEAVGHESLLREDRELSSEGKSSSFKNRIQDEDQAAMSQTRQLSLLEREIRESIRARKLTFKEYMALALYHPQWGYYTAQNAPGRNADFFTSVSVGSCFGELLAHYIHQAWKEAGTPAIFTVLEQGGHIGVLAADVIASIYANFPAFSKSFRLLAVERSAQAMTDPRLAEYSCWSRVPDLKDISEESVDLFFANELIDALPVHRVIWRGRDLGWAEHHVSLKEDALAYDEGPLSSPTLADYLAGVDVTDYQPGYITEVNLEITPWLTALTPSLKLNAMLLVIDYGMPSSSYYLPSRREGTLQGYQNHQRSTDLLANPGEQDLTAHVNFTQLQIDAESAGLQMNRLEEQSRFLTRLAKEPLMAMEQHLQGTAPDKEAMSWIRQFQQLTTMGPNFKVMELLRRVGSA